MANENLERPLASVGHEEAASELFPLTLSPEEYAAREAAAWMMFSFDQYQFRDTRLDAWIQRLGEIFRTPGLIDQYQEQYLTAEEIAAQKRRVEEDF